MDQSVDEVDVAQALLTLVNAPCLPHQESDQSQTVQGELIDSQPVLAPAQQAMVDPSDPAMITEESVSGPVAALSESTQIAPAIESLAIGSVLENKSNSCTESLSTPSNPPFENTYVNTTLTAPADPILEEAKPVPADPPTDSPSFQPTIAPTTIDTPLKASDNQIEMKVEKVPHFEPLEENVYITERKKSKREARRMLCDCVLTKDDRARGLRGCGDDCLNRMLLMECSSRCSVGRECDNKRFQQKRYAKVEPFPAGLKGWGLRTVNKLQSGEFIIEYVGEVITNHELSKRVKRYEREGIKHHYSMSIRNDEIIDATYRGNVARFLNHSCDPNAEVQKWTVGGELRIGFFAKKTLQPGEEITIDYQLDRYGKEAQECHCGVENCRKWIGGTEMRLVPKKRGSDKHAIKSDRSAASDEEEPDDEYIEDFALEEQINKISLQESIRSRTDAVDLARIMVRVEDLEDRLKLLQVIARSEQVYLRLLIDYHGLRIIWGWMIECCDPSHTHPDPLALMALKKGILHVLDLLPVPDQKVLNDSRVLEVVERWSKAGTSPAPITSSLIQPSKSDEEDSKPTPTTPLAEEEDPEVILACKSLLNKWRKLTDGMFKIPRLVRQNRIKDEQEADKKSREMQLNKPNSQQNDDPILVGTLRRKSLASTDGPGVTKRPFLPYNFDGSRQNGAYDANQQFHVAQQPLSEIEIKERRHQFELKAIKEQHQRELEKMKAEMVKTLAFTCGIPPPMFGALPPPFPPPPFVPPYAVPLAMTTPPPSQLDLALTPTFPILVPPAQPTTPQPITSEVGTGELSEDFFIGQTKLESAEPKAEEEEPQGPVVAESESCDLAEREEEFDIKKLCPAAKCPLISLTEADESAWTSKGPGRAHRLQVLHKYVCLYESGRASLSQIDGHSSNLHDSTYPAPGSYMYCPDGTKYFLPSSHDARSVDIAPVILQSKSMPIPPPGKTFHISTENDHKHDKLPPNWRKVLEPELDLNYYVHELTGRSQWNFPSTIQVDDVREPCWFDVAEKDDEIQEESMQVDAAPPVPTDEVLKEVEVTVPGPTTSTSTTSDSSALSLLALVMKNTQTTTTESNLVGTVMPNLAKPASIVNPILSVKVSQPQPVASVAPLPPIRTTVTMVKPNQAVRPVSVRRSSPSGGGAARKRPMSDKERHIEGRFTADMSQIVVKLLAPYMKPDCRQGRILTNIAFKELAKKLTRHILVKEKRQVRHVYDLKVTDLVKTKAKGYVRDYMRRCGPVYEPQDEDADLNEMNGGGGTVGSGRPQSATSQDYYEDNHVYGEPMETSHCESNGVQTLSNGTSSMRGDADEEEISKNGSVDSRIASLAM